MAEVLLVHGSCHGAWCWHRVLPELEALGIAARAIDLPGHGSNPAAAPALQDYAEAILAVLTGPTLLVGHSAGGYAITAAAEADPSRLRGLAYLCAYAPASGKSLAEMRRAGPSQPLAPAIRLSPGRSHFTIASEHAEDLLYHDCPAEDRAVAARLLCPEPVAPQETPLTLTRNSQDLPRFYIACTEDRTIPPSYQAQMALSVPRENRFALPTSHSPFFAAPQDTARLIAEILSRLPA
ncbi:alpha/beta fold hydrolase [Rhodobacter sp. SGA-6-6]|uniref:alpha/beta fold hydrolase n=1 Tax=Rhodobacter sp. SGA-6-6 TaxID=2710882 RepID=UPI0013ED7AB5|nr:alpha/beta fold hydrolase [Rhodobacter sp. SGA-6-6]NGM45269.1 alpha/beta fold hydrolase [Rhodobacter sp. SGA-6-6]